VSAAVLYLTAQRFEVEEDTRIDAVAQMLPSANCGGCGFAGCHSFAQALVDNEDISTLYCTVGGEETMRSVAVFLGKAAAEREPKRAVVWCGGCDKRPCMNDYDGVRSCAVSSSFYNGDRGCKLGCLGFGDCVSVCKTGAIKINPATMLPEVDAKKCTACNACVEVCPRGVIKLRKKSDKNIICQSNKQAEI
jgi:Na+-translocating ferredoxin:NAD+ oxidoreductase RNF subunit RnfB